jgi:hypothetical protein
LQSSYIAEDMSGLIAMWILGWYEELGAFLDGASRLPHYSFRLLVTVALIRSACPITAAAKEVIAEFEELMDAHGHAEESSDRSAVASGIAYLYFSIWRRSMPGGPIDRRVGVTEGGQAGDQTLIDRAVRYAEVARTLTQGSSMEKGVSALNRYLYYLLQRPAKVDWNRAMDLASELMAYSTDTNVWRYQYDNTLSLFYWSLAQTRPGDSRVLLNQARIYVGRAAEGSVLRSRVESYRKILASMNRL